MSPKLGAVHHVAITGADYTRNRHFYTGLLGFLVVREHRHETENGWRINLQLDDAELELFVRPDAPSRKGYPEAQGLRHLAFRVASVVKTAGALRRAGVRVKPLRTDACTGRAMCFFFDPNDLPLKLHE